MNQILNSETPPSIKILTSVSKETGTNIHWLLTGEGDMYLSKNAEKNESEINALKSELLDVYRFLADKGLKFERRQSTS